MDEIQRRAFMKGAAIGVRRQQTKADPGRKCRRSGGMVSAQSAHHG
jgi:hypothetical protein